ncbi:MAG: hypothetical protein E6X17_17480 [Sporomusaceae bacterium]|nr:hypothetical protein [Sporomusaceae bacterium]
MSNKKTVIFSLALILLLTIVSGCGSSGDQAAKPQPSQQAASSMPNEDPLPIVADLTRKLNDTAAMVKAEKLPEAKTIAAGALKTHERLTVHITDAKLKTTLAASVKAVSEAVNADPVSRPAAEARLAEALAAVKQAGEVLKDHQHQH